VKVRLRPVPGFSGVLVSWRLLGGEGATAKAKVQHENAAKMMAANKILVKRIFSPQMAGQQANIPKSRPVPRRNPA
jgi:hypothetical protein